MSNETLEGGVKDAISRRHSVRAYLDEPLADDVLAELFEAARLAPSSLNSQPWRFKAVTDRDTKAWIAGKEGSKRQSWLASAGAIILCCADISGYVRDSRTTVDDARKNWGLDQDVMEAIEQYFAGEANAPVAGQFASAAMNTALAVAFMMLRACELGLGTCWVGMFDEERIRKHLGLGDTLRVVALLAVGKPAADAPFVRMRKSLEEIVIP